MRTTTFLFTLIAAAGLPAHAVSARSAPISELLAKIPNQLVCEGYTENNWDIFIMNADGSGLRNLTHTPAIHELYPQVSPDGTKIAFVSDKGEGRTRVRSVWVMDLDGTNRRKIADYARQPFWAPNSRVLGYLPQEYKKFSVMDFATKGMVFYDLESGKSRPHPNPKLHHLYNPGFSPDGKWIAATVHAGMGFSHADILIQANGDKIVDLKVHGCRPCFSPDGKFLAWGATDHKIEIAPIDLAAEPKLGKPVMEIVDKKNKIYHVDWSPDGKVVTLSRGKAGKGDASKPGTLQAAREIVGVYAPGWNIFAVAVQDGGAVVDLQKPSDGLWKQLTRGGHSFKESDWVPGRK